MLIGSGQMQCYFNFAYIHIVKTGKKRNGCYTRNYMKFSV